MIVGAGGKGIFEFGEVEFLMHLLGVEAALDVSEGIEHVDLRIPEGYSVTLVTTVRMAGS